MRKIFMLLLLMMMSAVVYSQTVTGVSKALIEGTTYVKSPKFVLDRSSTTTIETIKNIGGVLYWGNAPIFNTGNLDTTILASKLYVTTHDTLVQIYARQRDLLKRNLNDHDSLSTLQEKSYNSLTDKPTIATFYPGLQDTLNDRYRRKDTADVLLSKNRYSHDTVNVAYTNQENVFDKKQKISTTISNDTVFLIELNNKKSFIVNDHGEVAVNIDGISDVNSFTVQKDSGETRITIMNKYDRLVHNNVDNYPYFQMIRGNEYGGTYRPMVTSDLLGRIGVRGPKNAAGDYNGDGNLGIDFFATENWETGKTGSRIALHTTSKGTNLTYFPLDVNNDFSFHSAVTIVGDGFIDDLLQVRTTVTSEPYFSIDKNGEVYLKAAASTNPDSLYGQENGIVKSYAASYFQTALTNPVTGTGTATHIPYFSGTSTITSSANFTWDNTNVRLGIGVLAPLDAIHIVGANKFIRFVNTGSTATGFYYYGGANGDGYVTQTASANSTITGSIAGDFCMRIGKNILFSTDGGTSALMKLSSTGFVGISNDSPTEKLHVKGGAIKDGIVNSTTIDTVNALRLAGTTTVWNDLVFPFTTGSTGGLSYPAFVADSNYFVFTPDTTGPAKCIIYKIIQMPHWWKEGSSVYPHVHYKHETAVGTPAFIVKYKWFNIGERTTPNWSWRRLELTTGTTDLTHQKAYSATPISGAGKTISSILLVQIYLRDAPTNVNAYQFDLHVEQAQLGSNTETSLN